MFKLLSIFYGRAVRRSHMAGWCNGSTSHSECGNAGSNPDPATKTDMPSVFDAVKGGGEVKKKQRCLLKRFAALVAALVLCFALCVPCFASNNASSKKWVIVAEDLRAGENGQLTRFFKVTPYSNGAEYATPITSITYSAHVASGIYDKWTCPVNYPDWWRADLPLGSASYVEISSPTIKEAYSRNSTGGGMQYADSVFLVPLLKSYALTSTFSRYSSATAFTGSFSFFPSAILNGTSDYLSYYGSDGIVLPASGESSIKRLDTMPNLVPGMLNDPSIGPSVIKVETLRNASSSQIIWVAIPDVNWPGSSLPLDYYADVTCVISYWIDASKLPAGLQVGDEFPSDTDAFDKLRDDLIDQFPEASENIQNGKDTLMGWNDTETVDTDVASSALSVLNGMFQNLGSFLFIVSLMFFGAVVLRMFIRKAVDG